MCPRAHREGQTQFASASPETRACSTPRLFSLVPLPHFTVSHGARRSLSMTLFCRSWLSRVLSLPLLARASQDAGQDVNQQPTTYHPHVKEPIERRPGAAMGCWVAGFPLLSIFWGEPAPRLFSDPNSAGCVKKPRGFRSRIATLGLEGKGKTKTEGCGQPDSAANLTPS